MSNDVQTAEGGTVGEPVGEQAEERKSRFTLPSAYTILFALIVLMAIATWIIPAGQYALNTETGSPEPGTYQEVESSPSRIIVDSLDGADQRDVRHRGPRHRQRRRVQQR